MTKLCDIKSNMGNTDGKETQAVRGVQPARTQNRIEQQDAALIQERSDHIRVLVVERTIVREVEGGQQPTCTYSSSKTQYVTQPFYRCRTCFKGDNEGCCAACVKVCHAGHNVYLADVVGGAFCDCGLAASLNPCKLSAKCTHDAYGPKSRMQPWFECTTCWGEGSPFGCCELCAKECHKGHRLRKQETSLSVCDCGLNRHRGDVCTFNATKTQGVRQPFYRCYECFTRSDQGCCYPCAMRCHDGHAIKPLGVVESFCDCGKQGCVVSCKIPQP